MGAPVVLYGSGCSCALPRDDLFSYLGGNITSRGVVECPNTGDHASGYTHLPLTFGHIHMAKTAGTNLNGRFAAKYERICGHKGYSYDAFQAYERRHKEKKSESATHISGDTVSSVYGDHNRERVPPTLMQERGFEDCDWISHEATWTFWKQFAGWDVGMEIHVPCRDPIDHLLSQCNHRKLNFDCSLSDPIP